MRETSVLVALLAALLSGCGAPAVEFRVADYLPIRESRVATEVLIPAAGDDASLLDAGWQPLDAADADVGLWVYGREADFRFWAVTVDDLTLEMETRQYAHPDAPSQVVEVSVNGVPAGLRSIPKRWDRIEIRLPAEALRHGWNRARLDFRHASAPSEYDPDNDDRRRLAARFRWLRLRAGDDRPPWPRSPGAISTGDGGGGDARLDLPTDSLLEATLVPATGTRLVGALDVSVATPGVTAAVELVDAGGETHVLYERRFDGPPWWRDGLDLGLGEWAGEPVMVRLVGRGPGRGVVRWYGTGFTATEDSPFSGDPVAQAAAPAASGRFADHDIFIILVDTLRADAVAPESPVPTPHIDRLAAGGTRFRQAWAPSSWTGQTVPALLSGLHPDAVGAEFWGSALPEVVPSLAELFADGGYFTSLWSQHNVYRNNGTLRRGWEAFEDVPSATGYRHLLPDAAALIGDDRPALGLVHVMPPHQPYEPPEPFRGSLTGPEEAFDVAGSALRQAAANGTVAPEYVHYARGRYDENVAFADHLVGRIVESLEQRGAYEEALVVLLSDHGEGFFEHGLFLHSEHLYEEFLHVPLIVKWPASAGEHAVAVDTPVSLVDLLATLADAAGLEAGDVRSQGRSLLPLAFDGTDRDRDVYAYTRGRTQAEIQARPVYALRSGRYKVIHDPGAGSTEVYDLLDDPGETTDLSGRQTVRARLLLDKLLLTRHRNGLFRAVVTEGVEAVELDEKAVEELRALGYIR